MTSQSMTSQQCEIVYTYSLAVSGIALLFNPRQELFPEGLPEGE